MYIHRRMWRVRGTEERVRVTKVTPENVEFARKAFNGTGRARENSQSFSRIFCILDLKLKRENVKDEMEK